MDEKNDPLPDCQTFITLRFSPQLFQPPAKTLCGHKLQERLPIHMWNPRQA